MASVPTTSSLSDAGQSGVKNGAIPGIGALVGKSVLGNGIGTALGGVAGAAALDGNARDRMAETAVFVGAAELGNRSGGSSSGGRGRM